MLLSQYQDDLKELHDKYIQQLCVLYRKDLPKLPSVDELFLDYNQKLECYLNIVKLNTSNSTIEEQNTEQEQDIDEEEQPSFDEFDEIKESAFRVMEDIESKKIFEDIVIDFENILDNIKPQENPQKVNNMLVTYYEEIHEVLQKRLDECQDIIEEYMTHLIENKKKELHQKMESYTMGEDNNINPNSVTVATKNEITQITEDHNEKLKQLREQYDHFLKSAEAEFFDVLKMIKIEPSNEPESEHSQVHSERNPDKKNETGSLAKMAREFLAQQEKNLGISSQGPTTHDNALQPMNSNRGYMHTEGRESTGKSEREDTHVKVGDLLNSEYAKSGMSVFDFNPQPRDKENESNISISSQVEFVDYNQEAKNGGYISLSAKKEDNEDEYRSSSSYYGSTKKHLQYPFEHERY